MGLTWRVAWSFQYRAPLRHANEVSAWALVQQNVSKARFPTILHHSPNRTPRQLHPLHEPTSSLASLQRVPILRPSFHASSAPLLEPTVQPHPCSWPSQRPRPWFIPSNYTWLDRGDSYARDISQIPRAFSAVSISLKQCLL
jgi:hypothetical protein